VAGLAEIGDVVEVLKLTFGSHMRIDWDLALVAAKKAHEMGYRDGLRESATQAGLLPVTDPERNLLIEALVSSGAHDTTPGFNLLEKIRAVRMPPGRR